MIALVSPCVVLHCFVLLCTALCCIALLCVTLCCVALRYVALQCFALLRNVEGCAKRYVKGARRGEGWNVMGCVDAQTCSTCQRPQRTGKYQCATIFSAQTPVSTTHTHAVSVQTFSARKHIWRATSKTFLARKHLHRVI